MHTYAHTYTHTYIHASCPHTRLHSYPHLHLHTHTHTHTHTPHSHSHVYITHIITSQRYYFVLRTSTPEEAASRPVGCTHVLLYYRSQDSAASGATPVGGMPIIRGRSTLGEIAKKVRGVYTPCLCVRTPGWRECLVAPAEGTSLCR